MSEANQYMPVKFPFTLKPPYFYFLSISHLQNLHLMI